MVHIRERIRVGFDGEGAGTGELTWGQLDLWWAMERLGTWLPLGYVKPLPEDASVADVVAELQFMISRYPTMRTRLRLDPDGTTQVVAGTGEVYLDVVDADDGDDPAKMAADLQRRYEETDYDFATDWPVRSGIVCHRGRPTHQVVVMCHLVSDAGGGRVIASDLAGREARLPPSPEPIRLAQWQRTPAARRQSRAAVRYTERVLRAMPTRRFDRPADPRQPRYWQVGFTSRAFHLALRAISSRTGVDAAPALLAVYVIALARVSGVNPVVTRVLVGNRFRAELADVVAPISQGGLLMVDVAGATFDEALARTRRRTMSAYKYAYYDPREIVGLEERVGQDRGEPVDVVYFFNDRRRAAAENPAGTAPAPTQPDVLAALPETTLRHERKQDEPLERLFVHVNDVPGTLDLTVLTDTHFISPADVEAFLRTMEAVAVEGAFDPAAPTRIVEPER